MTLPTYYPKANHTVQWFGTRSPWAGGASFTTCEKLLLHTTETQGWPGYPNFAPTLTYNPWNHEWRQHLPLGRSATTLADPGYTAVRENRDHVVQVEIVGYCDPQTIKRYGHDIHKIDTRAIDDLGDFARFLHDHGGLQLRSTVTWKDYPGSYGNNGVRLTGPQYDAYKGILGHQHASGNDHGDPGKINIGGILKAAGGPGDTKPWVREIWAIKKAHAYDGNKNRRPEHDLQPGQHLRATLDDHYADDGDYWRTGTKPHRIWYAARSGNFSYDKGGKPIT